MFQEEFYLWSSSESYFQSAPIEIFKNTCQTYIKSAIFSAKSSLPNKSNGSDNGVHGDATFLHIFIINQIK